MWNYQTLSGFMLVIGRKKASKKYCLSGEIELLPAFSYKESDYVGILGGRAEIAEIGRAHV